MSPSIHDRGLIYPFCGALAAIVVIVMYRVGSGEMPPSSIAGNLLIIGLGAGLVLARIGRLGPYNGRLGSPWFESDLDSALVSEVTRANRFGRYLTIAAARPHGDGELDWRARLRSIDRVFRCRDGWIVIILPETDQDGAYEILRRIEMETTVPLQATLISPGPHAQWSGRQLGSQAVAFISEPPKTDGITVHRRENVEHLPVTG